MKYTIDKDFGSWLEQKMEETNLSVDELASLLHSDTQYVEALLFAEDNPLSAGETTYLTKLLDKKASEIVQSKIPNVSLVIQQEPVTQPAIKEVAPAKEDLIQTSNDSNQSSTSIRQKKWRPGRPSKQYSHKMDTKQKSEVEKQIAALSNAEKLSLYTFMMILKMGELGIWEITSNPSDANNHHMTIHFKNCAERDIEKENMKAEQLSFRSIV